MDPNDILKQVTQGHSPANLVLASAPAAVQRPAESAAAAATQALDNKAQVQVPAVPPDPRVLADRVYELLRRELEVEQQRRGGKGI